MMPANGPQEEALKHAEVHHRSRGVKGGRGMRVSTYGSQPLVGKACYSDWMYTDKMQLIYLPRFLFRPNNKSDRFDKMRRHQRETRPVLPTLNTRPLAEISPTTLLSEAAADPGRETIGPASASPIAAEVRIVLTPCENFAIPCAGCPSPGDDMHKLERLRSDWWIGKGIARRGQ